MERNYVLAGMVGLVLVALLGGALAQKSLIDAKSVTLVKDYD